LLRRFLICGWSRVTVDADDHVDATDDGARGRFRQAGYGDSFARNVEQAAATLEKEVMMVTDVGVEIGGVRNSPPSQRCNPASINWCSVL
jgi:hypothetical protein